MAKQVVDKNPPDIATQIMQRMVKMPPKHHEDMKVGKSAARVEAKANLRKKREKPEKEKT
jgi:hypothetical protein